MNEHADFLAIQIHLSDPPYTNAWGNARASYYGVGGIPDYRFGGTTQIVGGSTGTYAQFLSAYQAQAGQSTDVRFEFFAHWNYWNQFVAQVRVSIAPDGEGKTMNVHIAKVRDYYPPTSDNRDRNCVLDGYTQTVTLAPGESTVVEHAFLMTDLWADLPNAKLVAYAQSVSIPKVIYQAAQAYYPWPEMPPDHLAGDMDCDGDVDFDDIDAFVLALNSQAMYEAEYADCRYLNGDMDGDGDVDFDDIDPFIEALGG